MIRGRPLSNDFFADDIDLMVGSNSELQALTDKLAYSLSTYGMETSMQNSKVNSIRPSKA